MVGCVVAILGGWLITILAPGGFSVLKALLVAAFLFQVPIVAIGFVSSALGFILMRRAVSPLDQVSPPLARVRGEEPITLRVALAMTLRNEEPDRSLQRLETVMASLERTGFGECFDCHVLSDSDEPRAIASEEAFVESWRARAPYGNRLFYRRRARNVGFKGGNVHDFFERHRDSYDVAVMLDADSLMSGSTILRMLRIMQANPRLGIVQTFAVGLPSSSLFARVFQFGHRLAMRCFVVGAAWWQGDCCHFWGHNCAIRVAPFADSCRLPILSGPAPFGGHILCHDQVEGALMRRAGYEVRFLTEESGSWEGNPPTLPDFIKRNDRWCLGNLQNLRLLLLPRFETASRFHLAYMAQKFFGSATVAAFAALAAMAAAAAPATPVFPARSALALYGVWLFLLFSPRLFGLLDALLRAPRRFGGRLRLLFSGGVEILFSFFLMPVSMFAAAAGMVALLFARTVSWDSQRRDGHRLSWRGAAKGFWPPTVYGLALLILLASVSPSAVLWFLPLLLGLLCAIPFAVVTSSPTLGAAAARIRLCGTPEEYATPPEIDAVRSLLSLV
jgi:membrane glycosyltransferase